MISAEAPTLAATVMSLSPQVILNRHKQFLLIPAGNVGGSYIDFAFAYKGEESFQLNARLRVTSTWVLFFCTVTHCKPRKCNYRTQERRRIK